MLEDGKKPPLLMLVLVFTFERKKSTTVRIQLSKFEFPRLTAITLICYSFSLSVSSLWFKCLLVPFLFLTLCYITATKVQVVRKFDHTKWTVLIWTDRSILPRNDLYLQYFVWYFCKTILDCNSYKKINRKNNWVKNKVSNPFSLSSV